MNESTIKGKWKDFKGEVQTQWGKITADDLEQTKGNIKSIIGLIEQKYGQAKDEASHKIHELAKRFDIEMDEKVANAESSAAKNTQEIKETLKDRIN